MMQPKPPPEGKAKQGDLELSLPATLKTPLQSRLTLLTYLLPTGGSKVSPLACVYCRQSITNGDDFQRVSRREYAHGVCAWRANDKFFALLDEEHTRKAKAPAQTTLGPS